MEKRPQQRTLFLLAAVFGVFRSLLAIKPSYREDWLLENVLVFISVATLTATYPKFQLSMRSYLLLFIFLCLHASGTHYTYAEV